jgi:subtilisin family serine protease
MLVASRILAEFAAAPAPADVASVSHWPGAGGRLDQDLGDGILIGIVDGGCPDGHPDIDPRRIVVRDCVGGARPARVSGRHIVHAITFLAGQGRALIRGLLPRARLLVGNTIGADGIACPLGVAAALDWMIGERADIIAIPLGGAAAHASIEGALGRAAHRGIGVLAAAGNVHPHEALFPARHAGVLSVGALDRRGALLPSCARRPRLDLAAPGHLIAAAVSATASGVLSGSSIATIVACAVHARRIAVPHHPSRQDASPCR